MTLLTGMSFASVTPWATPLNTTLMCTPMVVVEDVVVRADLELGRVFGGLSARKVLDVLQR